MRTKISLILVISLLILTVLACDLGSPATPPDTQATVDAAVAATGTAQMANQATIDAAVQATDAAQAASQATIDSTQEVSQATSEPALEATDSPPASSEEYVTMTEEELAALIDQAVVEAVAATEQSSTATTNATADNTVTAEEVQTIEVYVTGAEEAIALAEELLYVYEDLYGDLATETVAALEEINQSLQYLTDTIAIMNATLAEINSAFEQGLTLAEETIAELETAAQAAMDTANQIQEQKQAWAAIRQTQIENRASAIPSVEPNQIVTDPAGAIQTAFDFIETGQQALADGQVSPDELTNLAQQAANATASLNAQENPQLQQLSGLVTNVTDQMAQGNLSQAQEALNQLGVDTALAVPPNQVATDLPGAIQIAQNFAEAGNQSMADGNISIPELANLAQLGANANASLSAHGGPELQQLTGSITDITSQAARGNLPQAQEGLNIFGNSLGSIPDIEKPSVPDIDKPDIPDRPDRDPPSRPSRP